MQSYSTSVRFLLPPPPNYIWRRRFVGLRAFHNIVNDRGSCKHGVYMAKDSAEVIELRWILLEAKSWKTS
jgi:hypothetical protein